MEPSNNRKLIPMLVLRALVLFIAAGLAEIGGGWLVWQWLRNDRSLLVGLLGGVVLFLYGVIPTFQQEAAFGRIYAAYGGIFIVLSIIWGAVVDQWRPDRYDIVGAAVALTGVLIIMWGRRIF